LGSTKLFKYIIKTLGFDVYYVD